MNFYPHFLGDYARDTADLSLVEHGAYRVLLDSCYATEKPLPAEKRALYQIAKAMTSVERKAVDKVADRFFPVNGDGLRHNLRVDKELAKAHAYADAQSMRAHKRWHKQADIPEASRSDANHNHNQRNTTPLPPSGEFLGFWTAWPKNERKGAKGKCWSLWQRSNFDALATDILAHVTTMKDSDSWRGGFVPAPFVYLSQRRWEGADAEQPEQRKFASP